jgi:DNA polymerase V
MQLRPDNEIDEFLTDISPENSGIWLLKYRYMFGLADFSSFYCGTHELFNPRLRFVPHVTMSNNHGCIISRSKIAKQMGYGMSQNAFELIKQMKKDGVIDYSSNYEYYQSMSNRGFNHVAQFCDIVERYSIDELFMLFKQWDQDALPALGREIVRSTTKGVGVEICLGLAPTKLLAKVANKMAKKSPDKSGVVVLQTDEQIRAALQDFPVEDLWGIGPAYAKFLSGWNIYTALDLAMQPEYWVKQNMTVQSQRLWYELRGVSCVPMEEIPPDKKHICTSRSFAKTIDDFDLILKAISNHATSCAYKLRKDKLNCTAVVVFLQTDKFRTEQKQYNNDIVIKLDVYSNAARVIVSKALEGLRKIYRKGYAYKKTGVMLIDLIPESHQQTALLFEEKTHNMKVEAKLSKALDSINNRYGRNTVQLGAQGNDKQLQLNAPNLCPCYTTRIEDIMKIKIG